MSYKKKKSLDTWDSMLEQAFKVLLKVTKWIYYALIKISHDINY